MQSFMATSAVNLVFSISKVRLHKMDYRRQLTLWVPFQHRLNDALNVIIPLFYCKLSCCCCLSVHRSSTFRRVAHTFLLWLMMGTLPVVKFFVYFDFLSLFEFRRIFGGLNRTKLLGVLNVNYCLLHPVFRGSVVQWLSILKGNRLRKSVGFWAQQSDLINWKRCLNVPESDIACRQTV